VTIRKYLLAPRVHAAAFAVLPVIRATRRRPLGIRVGVVWLGWLATAALAVLTVKDESAARRTRTL